MNKADLVDRAPQLDSDELTAQRAAVRADRRRAQSAARTSKAVHGIHADRSWQHLRAPTSSRCADTRAATCRNGCPAASHATCGGAARRGAAWRPGGARRNHRRVHERGPAGAHCACTGLLHGGCTRTTSRSSPRLFEGHRVQVSNAVMQQAMAVTIFLVRKKSLPVRSALKSRHDEFGVSDALYAIVLNDDISRADVCANLADIALEFGAHIVENCGSMLVDAAASAPGMMALLKRRFELSSIHSPVRDR